MITVDDRNCLRPYVVRLLQAATAAVKKLSNRELRRSHWAFFNSIGQNPLRSSTPTRPLPPATGWNYRAIPFMQ
jgi:hypothetical protein